MNRQFSDNCIQKAYIFNYCAFCPQTYFTFLHLKTVHVHVYTFFSIFTNMLKFCVLDSAVCQATDLVIISCSVSDAKVIYNMQNISSAWEADRRYFPKNILTSCKKNTNTNDAAHTFQPEKCASVQNSIHLRMT